VSGSVLKKAVFTAILVVFSVALAIYYPFSEFLMFAFLGSFIIYLTSRMWLLALGTILYVTVAPKCLSRGNVGGPLRDAHACIAEPAEVI